MADVDLKSVYRSVAISKESQQYTGLKFELDGRLIYLYDTKLHFGSRLATENFHRLTQSVKSRSCLNIIIVVYLDDFLIFAPNMKECATALFTLVSLL